MRLSEAYNKYHDMISESFGNHIDNVNQDNIGNREIELTIPFEEFNDSIKKICEKKKSDLTYSYKTLGGLPTWEEETADTNPIHGVSTEIFSDNKIMYKLFPNHVKDIRYKWNGERKHTRLSYSVSIEHEFFWKNDYGKKILVEFRFNVGPQARVGNGSFFHWFHVKLDKNFEISEITYNKKDIKYNKSTITCVHNFEKFLNVLNTVWTEMPKDFEKELGELFPTFHVPSMGDTCCREDEDKIIRLLEKYGFWQKVKKMMNE